MADYDRQFANACKGGRLEEAKQLVQDHHADLDMNDGFSIACGYGHIEIAKWLVQDHQVDVHSNNEDAFGYACLNGHLETANWLIQDHQVDVHACNEFAFIWACKRRHIDIINWFMEEYRHSQSLYYFYNKTAYILNHEPLEDWQSCTILECPIIYNGKMDEQAVIAFMATLKKPKSARS